MNITQIDLSSTKIFLSMEGEALLSPLLCVICSLNGTYDCKEVISLNNDYQKYSITQLHRERNNVANQRQIVEHGTFSIKKQILGLLMEMTGNLLPERIPQTNFIYRMIMESTSL